MDTHRMETHSKAYGRLMRIFDCGANCNIKSDMHKFHFRKRGEVAAIVNKYISEYNTYYRSARAEIDQKTDIEYKECISRINTEKTPLLKEIDGLSNQISNLRKKIKEIENFHMINKVQNQTKLVNEFNRNTEDVFQSCLDRLEAELTSTYHNELNAKVDNK